MPDLREHLQELFGLDDFRPAQRDVIEDVLRGKDVLCVMPTGAGKSLCYQLPAAISEGLTLVVSPLISLMEDQVQQLRDEGIAACLLNSSLSAALRRQTLAELERGFNGLLYVAPERFVAADFQELMPRLKVKFLAIDEAHCVSQWGHDFRPEYMRIGEARQKLGSPPCIALTATATEDVRDDIIRSIGLREPTIIVTGFDRPNLVYECRRIAKVSEKDQELIQLVRSEPGSCIVYCATRKAVDELTSLLAGTLRDRPIFAYHAGMDQSARTANQERFMNTPRAVAVATNAFGMGINKPDVRLVIHYNTPGTLEAYYQEAGRAGRDRLQSRCVLLFSYQDRYTQEWFIEKIGEENSNADAKTIKRLKDHATQKLDLMIRYAQTSRCRRQMILDYFGDETEATNCKCDVCRRGRDLDPDAPQEAAVVDDDTIILVRQLLSAIARLNGKFGVGVVAEVLAGTDNEKTQRWGFNQLTVFGLLRIHSIKKIIAMLHRVMEAGLARQRDPDGVKFRPVIELTPSGVAVMKAQQLPPASLADLLPRRSSSSGRRVVPVDGDSTIALDPEAAQRFDRLRAVRSQLARDQQLPAYVICHDRTLKLIAHAAPSDLEGLQEVKGMGPHKAKLYGESFLKAIREPG
ncbi:MAG TPA: ATP-dependent DNA helicase RecQ [Humisphaera sp.]|jgi:ATP-dependent DNA helicase RecQ|nr:ATP-dependent DNA helicase RecQ [Humisphaera sp.]